MICSRFELRENSQCVIALQVQLNSRRIGLLVKSFQVDLKTKNIDVK